ncbi:serine hydrolase [Kribbella deserti]|uniref:Serine hydrolase n=1 Tax=Kribbella deserti TaxID=1926257 RepID=A0ABV6QNQ3_9ACTN
MGITELLEGVAGTGEFGVWLGRMDGTAVFTADADRTHYSASTMKLPVAIAMMREVEAGRLDLDQKITVHNDFPSAAGGRFGLTEANDDSKTVWQEMGNEVTLRWVATNMITVSGNLATDLVLDLVGIDKANAVLAEFGSGRSVIQRGIDDVRARDAGINNVMSPADLAAVLVAVGNNKAASAGSCTYLRDLLAANEWNDEIPKLLPAGTRVEHKNGWDDRVRHDGGIVRPADADPFVLAVCTSSSLPEATAQALIADIAAAAFAHRHDLAAVR